MATQRKTSNADKKVARSNEDTQKIQLRVWTPMLESLKAYADSACLKRDAYLAKVLDHELSVLQRCNVKNSDKASAYVHKELRKLKNTLTTFTFPAPIVARLNEVSAKLNIHRDCVFNRVLLLITPKNQKDIYNWLYSGDVEDAANQAFLHGIDNHPQYPDLFFYSSLHAVRARLGENPELADPLGYIREWLDESLKDLLDDPLEREPLTRVIYPSMKLKTSTGSHCMVGLNVRMPDMAVPGTDDHQKMLDDILEL